MKRVWSGLLAAWLLCGCSAVSNPEQLAASARDAYAGAQTIELVSNITSYLDEYTMDYQIQYSYHADTQTGELEVQKPASVAGIQASVQGEDFVFSYEDAELETAMPDKKGLTPADVTTYVLHDLQTKEPKQVWQENGRIALRYEDTSEEGNVVKEVYLHPDSFALAEAHIYNNGKQIMDCTVQSCTLQP